jgi:cytidine deaminase
VLLEAETRYKAPIKILMYSNDKVYVASSIKSLLPLSFGDEMLK